MLKIVLYTFSLIIVINMQVYGGQYFSKSIDLFDHEYTIQMDPIDDFVGQNGVVLTDTCTFLADHADWYYSPWDLNCINGLAKVEIIGDTLIGNRLCSVLGSIQDDELVAGSELIIFYELESEHVFFYEDEEYKVLYDFSLSVLPGDTIEYYLPRNFEHYSISSSGDAYLPSDEPYKYVVWDLPYINLPGGGQLRTIETRPIANGDDDCFDMGVILNGIGSREGFLGRACPQLTMGCGPFFRCFESIPLDYTEVDGACLISSTTNLVDIKINIYPNPTNKYIHIETDHDFIRTLVYNPNGQLMLDIDFNSQVRMNRFPTGDYVLVLLDKVGHRYSHLITVE